MKINFRKYQKNHNYLSVKYLSSQKNQVSIKSLKISSQFMALGRKDFFFKFRKFLLILTSLRVIIIIYVCMKIVMSYYQKNGFSSAFFCCYQKGDFAL